MCTISKRWSQRGVAIEYQHPSFFPSSVFCFYQILITHRSCKPQGIKCFVRDINMIWNIRWNKEKKKRTKSTLSIFITADWCKRMYFDVRPNALYLWYLTIFMAWIWHIDILMGIWSSSSSLLKWKRERERTHCMTAAWFKINHTLIYLSSNLLTHPIKI